jgi:hypothetical protein
MIKERTSDAVWNPQRAYLAAKHDDDHAASVHMVWADVPVAMTGK